MRQRDRAARRGRLRRSLATVEADHLLVTDAANVRYLTGFTGTNGQLLLGASADHDRLLTDGRYTERAAVEAPDLPAVITRDPAGAAIDAVVESGAIRGLAVEADAVTWATADLWQGRAREQDVELVATIDLVAVLRAVKDPAEIATLTEACRITVTALEELIDDQVRVGVSERDLATWLERRFVDLGAERAAFDSIVAAGPNAAVPHHAPTDRRLVAGDLLTIDCGARVGGYHADCTRTVAIGHPGDQLAAVHDLVERAQAAGRTAAIAGATAGDVDAACRDLITDEGYGEAFVHGTGHGVGLEIHEAPAVARSAGATLRAGTAMTVEPGVYLPGTGGVRIEDTIVVTADGDPPDVLTDLPRTLRIL